MKNYRVNFNFLDRNDCASVGNKYIICHLIFNVKINPIRKSIYMAVLNRTDTPSSMTYPSVVIIDSVRLVFLIAELNDLDMLAGDIQNAYLNAPTKEKLFFYAVDKWKYDQGEIVIVLRALYGLKSSALILRNNISDIPVKHL